jgi:hypothetical protein
MKSTFVRFVAQDPDVGARRGVKRDLLLEGEALVLDHLEAVAAHDGDHVVLIEDEAVLRPPPGHIDEAPAGGARAERLQRKAATSRIVGSW